MARGWESKSVESQIEDREHALSPSQNAHLDAPRERELSVLELTRKRLEYEIAMASTRGFRIIKKRALDHVEQRIRELSEQSKRQ